MDGGAVKIGGAKGSPPSGDYKVTLQNEKQASECKPKLKIKEWLTRLDWIIKKNIHKHKNNFYRLKVAVVMQSLYYFWPEIIYAY